MTARHRILTLILILIGVVGVSGGTAILILYRTAVAEQAARLADLAHGQARLVETFAAHARQTHGGDAAAAAETIIAAADAGHLGGSEVRFARLDGDRILYLGGIDRSAPRVLPMNTTLAEPMRRALAGETGTCIGFDLRGDTVLAAFEPIASLGWGVVAKSRLAEVRQPFIVAGTIAGVISLALVALGAWWFTRVTQPMLDELRERDERLRFAMMTSQIGLWDLDLIDRSAFRSPEHDAIFGYPEPLPTWTYERFLGHVLAEDRARVDGAFQRAVRDQGDWSFECRILRADGVMRWIWAAGRHRTGGSGPMRRMAGIVQDITERKLAEAEIRRLNTSLELRVAERTAELEAANRELEAFSYSVSHDLRSPLRAIAGFSTALEEDAQGRLDATSVRYLAVIRRETGRMGELIDDLLRLSRLTRSPLTRQAVDLSALAEAVGVELRQREPGRAVALTVAPGLRLTADPGMLRIVLENLLANAWKFTAKRDLARIEVAALPGRRPGFVVRDDGVGFDMAYAERLFGAFQRLHSQAEFPGTGIGLATVARIVRRHGGSVRAEAAPDHGAAIFISFPEDPTS